MRAIQELSILRPALDELQNCGPEDIAKIDAIFSRIEECIPKAVSIVKTPGSKSSKAKNNRNRNKKIRPKKGGRVDDNTPKEKAQKWEKHSSQESASKTTQANRNFDRQPKEDF